MYVYIHIYIIQKQIQTFINQVTHTHRPDLVFLAACYKVLFGRPLFLRAR